MAQTWYLKIRSLQPEPFDMLLDKKGRQQWGFNLMAEKRPSHTFLDELRGILETAGLGTLNVSIFTGTSARVPDGSGVYVVLTQTSGAAPNAGAYLHNEPDQISYPNPTAQIVVISEDPDAAKAKAFNIFDEVLKVKNKFVTVP